MGSQTFTTPGADTFNVPAGVTRLQVWCIGGGGGGANVSGGINNTSGGGGGGGGQGIDFLDVTPLEVINVQVGAGGAAEAAGSDSWFKTSGTINGNGGDPGSGANGGAGGGAVGSTTHSGGNGGDGGTALGYYYENWGGGGGGGAGGDVEDGHNGSDGNGDSNPQASGGAGGNTNLNGGTGDGGAGGANGNGADGSVYGGGGGGAGGGAAGRTGGAGADGIVYVQWTTPEVEAVTVVGVSRGDRWPPRGRERGVAFVPDPDSFEEAPEIERAESVEVKPRFRQRRRPEGLVVRMDDPDLFVPDEIENGWEIPQDTRRMRQRRTRTRRRMALAVSILEQIITVENVTILARLIAEGTDIADDFYPEGTDRASFGPNLEGRQ